MLEEYYRLQTVSIFRGSFFIYKEIYFSQIYEKLVRLSNITKY